MEHLIWLIGIGSSLMLGKVKVCTYVTLSSFLLPQVSAVNPIKLFAEVTLNSVAVMEARVTAELRALNQSGHLSQPVRVELLDTGSGGEY